MRSAAVALAFCAALACGGGAATRPGGARDEVPTWLAEGTGAFRDEGGSRLQGVGVASGIADPKARRRQADGAAREQLQVAVDSLAQALSAQAPQDRAAVAAIARSAGARASAIRDHWVTPDGDERALGVIELDAFKRALQGVDGDDRVKSDIYGNVDRAFDQVASR
jgi:hypothetical protein